MQFPQFFSHLENNLEWKNYLEELETVLAQSLKLRLDWDDGW